VNTSSRRVTHQHHTCFSSTRLLVSLFKERITIDYGVFSSLPQVRVYFNTPKISSDRKRLTVVTVFSTNSSAESELSDGWHTFSQMKSSGGKLLPLSPITIRPSIAKNALRFTTTNSADDRSPTWIPWVDKSGNQLSGKRCLRASSTCFRSSARLLRRSALSGLVGLPGAGPP